MKEVSCPKNYIFDEFLTDCVPPNKVDPNSKCAPPKVQRRIPPVKSPPPNPVQNSISSGNLRYERDSEGEEEIEFTEGSNRRNSRSLDFGDDMDNDDDIEREHRVHTKKYFKWVAPSNPKNSKKNVKVSKTPLLNYTNSTQSERLQVVSLASKS